MLLQPRDRQLVVKLMQVLLEELSGETSSGSAESLVESQQQQQGVQNSQPQLQSPQQQQQQQEQMVSLLAAATGTSLLSSFGICHSQCSGTPAPQAVMKTVNVYKEKQIGGYS